MSDRTPPLLRRDALEQRVYDHLHSIAQRMFRAQPAGSTLQATALVHEAFLKLATSSAADFADQQHFLAVAARAMRQILVHHARKKRSAKRGGDLAAVTLSGLAAPGEQADVDVLSLEAVSIARGTGNLAGARKLEVVVTTTGCHHYRSPLPGFLLPCDPLLPRVIHFVADHRLIDGRPMGAGCAQRPPRNRCNSSQ